MKKTLKMLFVTLLAVCLFISVVHAEETKVVMTVNGTEYTDHGTGWSAAVKLASGGTDVTVKLFADWIADAENGFVCPDVDTKYGALYVGGGKVTIDLNGCTLDRNASQEVYVSSVIYVEDCNFTVDDTSEEKDGKITGGHIDAGGGIYANDANLTLNGGNISGNKAENGAGVYLDDSKFTMNGGSITDNYATKDGGGVYVICEDFTMNGGVIARNYAGQRGGAFCIKGTETSNYEINMYGGVIEENYAATDGGVAYIFHFAEFIMHDGIIRNNRAKANGGALATEPPGGQEIARNKIILKGGTLTGNVAEEGNGGAIRWDVQDRLYLSNCTITGNSAPFGRGGGVYIDTKHSDGIAFGGTVNITGNTAVTDRLDNDSNVYIYTEDLSQLRHDYEDYGALNTDSKIGLTYGMVNLSDKTELNDGGNFTKEVINCFILDDPYYTIVKEKRSNGNYDFYLGENPDYSVDNPCMTVETKESGKLNFGSLRRGWEYAIEQAKNTDVVVTLHSDWKSAAGNYSYNEESTHGGGLYIPRSCKNNITIDLNGYTIDRNLESKNVYLLHKGFVFYVDCAGSLTITDSSEAQTGTITGGKNAWLWGPLEARLNGCGGAFHVEYGTLYIKGGNITGNIATYGGAIYINDVSDAAVHISGGKIYGNTAEEGGAIYANNGYLYVDGGEITGNTAEYGGGIYWDSLDAGYFTGGKIYGNTATEKGGGMYVESYSDTYYGGDIQIFGNTNGNLYLDNPENLGDNTSQIFNACGQNGSPNKPLTDGAYIGIHVSNINKQLTGFTSSFNEGDFEYFHPDISSYFIRSVYKPNGEGNDHRLYFNTWGHEDARYPRVKSVSVKDSNLLTDAVLDYDTQTITLTAHNTRRNFFERAVLSDLIECTYDKDIYYLYQMDYMRDLRELQKYKIMSDNGTYVLCKVQVVPEGGKWADEQESVDNPYKMIVKVGASSKGFNDFGEGWVYATSQSSPVAITLFADWNATDGEFEYSSGTNKGRLYVNNKDVTIDLNGNTINRNLEEATSDGQVFRIAGGSKLTIVDNSATGNGKITGGNNKGNGGAFYIDYGKLYIDGGEISGNSATNGGGIYSTNEDDSFVYINGGKITGNTATENGGAIFMEEGFLYMDSGEISGNYATNNGGGIYWNSENKLCLTGGKITGNKAKEGGGVYGTDCGKMYVGGTIVVKDNLITNTLDQNNFFLSDTDVYLNNAAEQSQIPNKPLTDGACVGIHGAEADTLISSPDSRFNVDSAKYFKADHDMYWVYGWYDGSGGDNTYKLYYNFDALGSELPRIKSVESKSDLVEASLNSDSYAITLTADMKVKKLGTLENAKLSELIDATFNRNGVQIMNFDTDCNYTEPQKVMVIDVYGLYSVYMVTVEWICSEHTDADNDYVCDECGEYTFSNTTIVDYNAQTQETTVFVTNPGKYSLIFADYENNSLENVDIVKCDFKEGTNVIPQGTENFTLADGDKVMLWYDMIDQVPVCKELTIK